MANLTKIETRKTQILKTAERIFGEKGFQDTTISEIAKEAKISEASIYEYFSTKEGLLFSVPTKNASELFKLMQFHLKLIRGAENKLRSIISIFLSTNEKNTNNASIIMLTAQLLYEIRQPAYLTPDVKARFDTIKLKQEGKDRVSLDGIKGEPPTDLAKVCINNLFGQPAWPEHCICSRPQRKMKRL